MPNASTILTVADGIVALLNGSEFAIDQELGFEAERVYTVDYSLETISTLRVTVMPAAATSELASRSQDLDEVTVHVAVQKKVDLTDNSEVDGLMAMVEAIGKFIGRDENQQARRIGDALWEKTENSLFFEEHLRTKSVFTGVLMFSFRIVQ